MIKCPKISSEKIEEKKTDTVIHYTHYKFKKYLEDVASEDERETKDSNQPGPSGLQSPSKKKQRKDAKHFKYDEDL